MLRHGDLYDTYDLYIDYVHFISDMESTKHLQESKFKPDVYFPNILSPYFRSPFTDVFGSIINHQQYGKCATFEMNMMECMEAYGYDKGKVKCADLIDDFNECHSMTKQVLRHLVCTIFVIVIV